MYGLSLFSGIGGIDVALSEYVSPVAYCEIDKYCQSVLLQRMSEGNLPKAPIWEDVRTLPIEELPPIDIIYGGFPCQDISVAGAGKGLEGERSGLFFEIMRLVREAKPTFVFLENVPAIRTRGLDRVLQEFTKERYDCRWTMLSAAEVGARHKRERWFLLANSKGAGTRTLLGGVREGIIPNGKRENVAATNQRPSETCADVVHPNVIRLERSKLCKTSLSIRPSERLAESNNPRDEKIKKDITKESEISDTTNDRCDRRSSDRRDFREEVQTGEGTANGLCEELSNTSSERLEGQCKPERIQEEHSDTSDTCKRTAKSRICGIADDVSITLDTIEKTTTETKHRVDRIKALGNSVVPLQVRTAFKRLMGLD